MSRTMHSLSVLSVLLAGALAACGAGAGADETGVAGETSACVPTPTPEPCEDVPDLGCCEGSLLKFCKDGKVQVAECSR
ncbi:MAG: hypothetical protein FJ087_11190 [Deltaproteobacteria bacterium]|nr:hypothetical protein [Deltaproteobacteria bacterium]